jgi:transposase
VAQAKELVNSLSPEQFIDSQLTGYRLAQTTSYFGDVEQRWVIVESVERQQSAIKKLCIRLDKVESTLEKQLGQLCRQEFQCELDAMQAAQHFAKKLKYHCLEAIEVVQQTHHVKPGRPRKDAAPNINYQIRASLVGNQTAIKTASAGSGRFILASNVINDTELSPDKILQEYKQQQSPERGFRFLKDPLFFTSSVFLKSPERVAALALIMGLCLLVYSIGQRQLRQALVEAKETLNNQLGQATQRPTLRWVFQCFQDVHLLQVPGIKQIANLTYKKTG